MLDLQVDQTFESRAASVDAQWDLVTSTGLTNSAKRSAFTISYDAATSGYTLMADGRAQTFYRSDIQEEDEFQVTFERSGAPDETC